MTDAVVESLVAREIEKAWREGWATGYNAGLRDGRSDGTYWCDEDGDWHESEARKLISPPSDVLPLEGG